MLWFQTCFSSIFITKICTVIFDKLWTLWCRIPIDDVYDSSRKKWIARLPRITRLHHSLSFFCLTLAALFLSVAPVELSGSPAGSFWHSCRFSTAAYLRMGTYLGFPAPFTPSGVPKAEEDERPQLSKIWRRVHPQFWQQTPICAIFAPTSQFFQVLKVLYLVFL